MNLGCPALTRPELLQSEAREQGPRSLRTHVLAMELWILQ